MDLIVPDFISVKNAVRALCLCAMLWPSLLVGDQNVEGAQIEESAKAESFLFGEEPIVTSAARREQPLHEASFAVTVFTRDDLRLFGVHSLGDVLRLVPGMDVIYVLPGFTFFNVRGMGSEKNVRTLVLVDGRIANIEALGPSMIETFPVSPDEIERIEVIRGGGSAMYGANAYSGVISIITRSPEKTPMGWTSLIGGAQPDTIATKPLGTSSATAGSGYWRNGTGGYRVSAGYRQSNDWIDPLDIVHRVTWGRVLMGTDIVPGARLSLEGGGAIIKSNTYASFKNIPYEAREYFTQLKGTYGGLAVNGYFKHIHVDAVVSQRLANIFTLSLPITGDTSSVTLDAQYSLPIGTQGLLISGLNARYMLYDITLFRKTLRGIDLDREYIAGGFLHFEYHPLTPLSLIADARYDWFSITKPALSPRLALLYSVADGHILRAAAGQSFRKPLWLEAQAVSSDPLLKALFGEAVGNPDVGNELVRTTELGYRGYPAREVKVEGNLFYNQYYDSIGFHFSSNPLKFRAENDRALLWGAGGEVETEYKPFSWLSTGAWYSLLLGTGYFSQQKAALTVKYLPPGLPFLGLAGNYTGPNSYAVSDPVTLTDVSQPIPAYVLVNGTIGYSFLQGKAEAGVFVFNLFNHRHKEFASLEVPEHIGAEVIGQKLLLYLRAGW